MFEETMVGQSKEFPARMAIFAEPKLGKTTFAADAEDVFFLNIEGGTDYLKKKVRSTPKLETYDEVIGWLKHIYDTDTFKAGTIAVDSADWIEELAQKRLIKNYNASSITDPKISDFSYYKGVMMAANDSIAVLRWLDAIYKKKGIKCIIIAHSQVKSVDLPNEDPFSRHELKLSKWFAAKINEWVDLLVFGSYSFHITKDGKTSTPKRVLKTGGSAAFVGGGRMNIPNEIAMDYKTLEKEITK